MCFLLQTGMRGYRIWARLNRQNRAANLRSRGGMATQLRTYGKIGIKFEILNAFPINIENW